MKKKTFVVCKSALCAMMCVLIALSLYIGLFCTYGEVNAFGSGNESYTLPTPAVVYVIGDSSVPTDTDFTEGEEEGANGESIPVYTYSSFADGYSAAVAKAAEIMYLDNPLVKVVLAADWKAVQPDRYALLTQFGKGDGFNSGMLSVPYGSYIMLDLNGHVLSRGLDEPDANDRYYVYTPNGSVIDVQGSLLLCDSEPTAVHDGSEYVGGIVTGGKATIGGGLHVNVGGKLYVYGGNIVGNEASISGGGVALMQTAFMRMYDGSVSDNTAQSSGGGINLDSAYLDMRGGSVSGNNAFHGNGGGIYGAASTGGTSVDAFLYDEDGYLYDGYYSSQIEISGGSVYNNRANASGGGVYYSDLRCSVVNASITDNVAGGVQGTGGIYGTDTLRVGGKVVIKDNVAERSEYANINLSGGANMYAAESFEEGAEIRISNAEIYLDGYDGHNNNSIYGQGLNIGEDGLPRDPNLFISYADCEEYEGQYHAVRQATSGDSQIRASKYYARWDVYYIDENGSFGDKIVKHSTANREQLDNGGIFLYYYNDYDPRPTGSDKNKYAMGFKATVYVKNSDGTFSATSAADMTTTIYRRGHGSIYNFLSEPSDYWQAVTTSEYDGEKFYLLIAYRAKSIEDDDVKIKVVFDESKLDITYRVDAYQNLILNALFGIADGSDSVIVYIEREGFDESKGIDDPANAGKFVKLVRDTDFYVTENDSRSVKYVHACETSTVVVLGRGNYTGKREFEYDDNGVQFKPRQSSGNYYFKSWNMRTYYGEGDGTAFQYTGRDFFEKVSLDLIVGDLPNMSELSNANDFIQTVECGGKDSYYSTDDRGFRFKFYKYDGTQWRPVTEAVGVGKYKVAIDRESVADTNCSSQHIFDEQVASGAPEGTAVYEDYIFDIVALEMDFDLIFSRNNGLIAYDENDEFRPPAIYLEEISNVRGSLGDYVGFEYFDAVLNESKVTQAVKPNAAYYKNGKVEYVKEDEEISYVYYAGNDISLSLSDSLVIGAEGGDAFLEGGRMDDERVYWKENGEGEYTGILMYYGTPLDLTKYKDSIGSFYSGGIRINEIADVSYSHEVSYSDGDSETVVDAPVKGKGSGVVTLVTTTATISFAGYADKDGNMSISFQKKWAIVSACNALHDESGEQYKYTSASGEEIYYGAGNQTAPVPEYGSVVVLSLKDPKNKVTEFAVEYEGGKAVLYKYDSSASTPKGEVIELGFAGYINELVAKGGVGDYTLTARPDEYADPLSGLVYFGAEEEYLFTVIPRPIVSAPEGSLEIEIGEAQYSGGEVKPTVTVKYDGQVIPESNYTVSYENNTNAGEATVTITGAGIFSGEKEAQFTIAQATDNAFGTLYIADWWYTKFDPTANRVFATAKYGYDNATFDVMKAVFGTDGEETLEKIDDKLMGFALGDAGVVPDSVADLLNALTSGKYLLRAKVAETANYNGVEGEYYFAVYATKYEEPSLSLQSAGIGKNDVYTGNTLSITIDNFNSVAMTMQVDERLERNGNTLYAQKAGRYAITFVLNDPENSSWADGEGSTKTVYWVVEKQSVKVPTAGENSFFITGDLITYLPEGFDPETMNISGNTAIESGSYDALVTLKDPDNYKWENPDYGEVITRSFVIIGADRIFAIVMGILGGVILIGIIVALVQYVMHRQRMQVFEIAESDKEENEKGGKE